MVRKRCKDRQQDEENERRFVATSPRCCYPSASVLLVVGSDNELLYKQASTMTKTAATATRDEPTMTESSIFAALEQMQSGHGIPHQDYAQYHTYCTQRLARLRRVKEVRPFLVHNPKYVTTTTTAEQQQHSKSSASSRRRHAYAARVRDEVPAELRQHDSILWNTLMQAERAWAQACALQAKDKKNHHHHVQRRLHKARKLATRALLQQQQQLTQENISASGADGNDANGSDEAHGDKADALKAIGSKLPEAQTRMRLQELASYVAWMKGNAALEQHRHADAFQDYEESRNILLQLVQQQEESTADNDDKARRERLALQDIWTTRAESLLRPLVRYCQYEARVELLPVAEEDPSTASTTTTKAPSSSIVLNFRGKDICLDDASYKQLAVLYLKWEDLLTNKERQQPDEDMDESHFLQVLSDLDDALNWTKAEYSHYESFPAGPAITAKRQELSTLSGYFQYQKLSIWRQQQEKRVSELDTADPAAFVHIYDTLQRNAQAMADLLVSTSTDADDDVDNDNIEDDPFWLEAQAHVVRIRAFRCYYLARLYESSASPPSQVLALLRHATQLAKRAQEEVAACSDESTSTTTSSSSYDLYLEALEDLLTQVRVMSCRVEATLYLQTHHQGSSSSSSQPTDRPLWLRLHDLDAGTVLADDPPLAIPIPTKPAFFDIAWQHIGGDLPTGVVDDYLARHAEEPKSSSRGILSWLSGS